MNRISLSQQKLDRLNFIKVAPFKTLMLITFIIWVAESLIMLLLNYLPKMPEVTEAIVDSTILSVVSAPAIWFWIIRPLVAAANRYLSHLESIEKALDASALVIMTDSEGKVVHVNSRHEEVTGYAAEEVLGMDARELGRIQKFAGSYEKISMALKEGKMWHGELQNHNKSGISYWVDTTIVPVFTNPKKAPAHITIQYDISERKKLEQNILKAKNDAERATDTKRRFLANISHEIRTPMNGIIGMASLLNESVKDPVGLERLQVIQQCGVHLLELIDDVLDFSKLEADKVVLENQPFSPAQAIEDVSNLFRFKAEEKHISLNFHGSLELPECVVGDVTRLRQILTNLVGNAVKFTNAGQINIFSSATQSENDSWRLQFIVQDTGLGIEPELQQKLFQSFSQVDASTTRKFGGSGLGLAISKGLCEKMGGSISVESCPGEGTTFSFSIVVAKGDSKELPAKKQEFNYAQLNIAKQNYLRILIVEDNPNNRMVLLGFLDRLGYQADIACDGIDALNQLEKRQYDIVFMDCHMPKMDGFEATEKIVQRYSVNRPKIIAVTASFTREDVQKCISIGMDDVLGKPISMPKLINILSDCKSITKLLYQEPTFDQIAYFANFPKMSALAYETIEVFLDVLPRFRDGISESIVMKDAKNISASAHALKGSLSNFFARSAYTLASELEVLGQEEKFTEAELHSQKLQIELNRLEQDLRNVLDKKAF